MEPWGFPQLAIIVIAHIIRLNRVGENKSSFLLLLFSTSHTTVRTVRYTAVQCFDILRCVRCCFQSSLRGTSLLRMFRGPLYHSAKSLFSSIWLLKTLKATVIYYHTAQFRPSQSNSCFGTMSPADFLWQLLAMRLKKKHPHVRKTSRGKTITFVPYICIIYPWHIRVALGLRFVWQTHPTT